jgi:beta-lactamase class A
MTPDQSSAPLEERVISLARSLPGTAGVVIYRPRTGQRIAFNERFRFPSASLIKLPILSEYARRVSKGQLDPGRVVEVRAEDIVGGSGVIKDLGPGLRLRLMDLATLMIIVSDNAATNMLIEILGLESINRMIREMGLEQTELQRRLMDFESRRHGLDNFTSPADMAGWFEGLLAADGDHAVDNPVDDAPPGPFDMNGLMLEILGRQQERNKLPARLPEDVLLAHKTGEMSGVEHDAGIMWLADEPVIVVAMSCDLARNTDGINFCQEIGQVVFETWGGPDERP